jgi:hypothetical protein
MLRFRRIASGALSILALMVAAACGASSVDMVSSKLDPLGQQESSAKSIAQCGLKAVAEPFAGTPNSLKRATEVYQVIDSTGDAVGALESVYGKSISSFTYEEQAEVLHILSGLDSCGEAAATAPGAIALLLSGQPADPATPTSAPAAPPAAAAPSALAKPVSAPAAPTAAVTPPAPAPRTAAAAPPAPASTSATPTSAPTTPTSPPCTPPCGHTKKTPICTLPEDPSTGSPCCVPVQPGQVPPPTDDEYARQGRSVDDCWLKYLPTKSSGAATQSDNTTGKNLNDANSDGQLRFGGSSGVPDKRSTRKHPHVGGN